MAFNRRRALDVHVVVDQSADDDEYQENPKPREISASGFDADFSHSNLQRVGTQAGWRRVRSNGLANRTPAGDRRWSRAPGGWTAKTTDESFEGGEASPYDPTCRARRAVRGASSQRADHDTGFGVALGRLDIRSLRERPIA